MNSLKAPPAYPVINSAPSVGATLRNLGLGDYAFVIGFGLFGSVWGYAAGGKAPEPTHLL